MTRTPSTSSARSRTTTARTPGNATSSSKRYGRLGKTETILVAAPAHHRLAWIHPFRDGNGRVARRMSHATLLDVLDTGAVWSIARGLARNVGAYKTVDDCPSLPSGSFNSSLRGCRHQGSNPGPSVYKTAALPTELCRRWGEPKRPRRSVARYLMTCRCDGRDFGLSPLASESPLGSPGSGADGLPTSDATGSPDTVNAKP